MQIRKNTKSLIFITILAVLFSLAALATHLLNWEIAYGLSCNIAATCLAVILLAWAYTLTGGEPLEEHIKELKEAHPLIETGIHSGLLEVSHERQYSKTQINGLWTDFLDQEKMSVDRVDIIGNVCRDIIHSLYSIEHRNSLISKVTEGCNIRILILSPKGRSTEIRRGDEGGHELVGLKLMPDLPDTIGNILREVKAREGKGKGSFRFGFYDVTPYCNIIRIGYRMLVTNYLYGMMGRDCPMLFLQAKSDNALFAKYVEHFENVWKSGKVWVYELDELEQEKLYRVDRNGQLETDPTTDEVW